jgi:hypothetical protein
LLLHFSLMGETKPALSPFSVEYSFDDKALAYRYDWQVGITPPKVNDEYWDWMKEIRENRAIAVQLLIDPGQSGCGFSEISAMLLALQPSKDTSSWLDQHAKNIGEGLGKLAEIAQPINTMATNIIKVSSLMSNFIGSGEQGAKNWFIYRFLDEGRRCCAVEWNINLKVLKQYGPLLRGSIILTFHGTRKKNEPMRMLLRPRLGFGTDSDIAYVPPAEELEKELPVELLLDPTEAPVERPRP